MPTLLVSRLPLVVLIGVLALIPVSAGAEARTERIVRTVDVTDVVPAAPDGPCAFAVTVSATGTARTTLFFDQVGNLVKVNTVFVNYRVTFEGNGRSLTTVSPDPIQVRINPNGSATVAINGLMGHIIAPGKGLVAADVGRIVLFFESRSDPEPDILQVTGLYNDEGDPLNRAFPAVCDALSV